MSVSSAGPLMPVIVIVFEAKPVPIATPCRSVKANASGVVSTSVGAGSTPPAIAVPIPWQKTIAHSNAGKLRRAVCVEREEQAFTLSDTTSPVR